MCTGRMWDADPFGTLFQCKIFNDEGVCP
jgi:hypothetical protein